MNAIIALIGFKSNLRMMHTERALWINTQTVHPFLIGDHVGFTYQNGLHSQRFEIIANVTFPNTQRNKVSSGTVG